MFSRIFHISPYFKVLGGDSKLLHDTWASKSKWRTTLLLLLLFALVCQK